MTYEYVCTECGHEWEADQRISDSALSDCPSCNRNTAKRLVTGGMGFVLKGSGWYSDLYGLKPKAGGGGGELGTSKPSADGPKAESAANSSTNSADSKVSESKVNESKPETPKKDSSVSAA